MSYEPGWNFVKNQRFSGQSPVPGPKVLTQKQKYLKTSYNIYKKELEKYLSIRDDGFDYYAAMVFKGCTLLELQSTGYDRAVTIYNFYNGIKENIGTMDKILKFEPNDLISLIDRFSDLLGILHFMFENIRNSNNNYIPIQDIEIKNYTIDSDLFEISQVRTLIETELTRFRISYCTKILLIFKSFLKSYSSCNMFDLACLLIKYL